jgi:hypothetical protein
MRSLLGESRPTKQARHAQVSVEGLEDRALMAANFTNFSIVNTLNARDTINIQELNVIQSIEQEKLAETAHFQQVIADGQNRSNALVAQYIALLNQEAADRQAGNAAAVAADLVAERNTLLSAEAVRGFMRQATVVDNTVQATLSKNWQAVINVFNNTQNNLANGNNPFLTVPHAVTAMNLIGAQAAQHAHAGQVTLTALQNQINGPLFVGQD